MIAQYFFVCHNDIFINGNITTAPKSPPKSSSNFKKLLQDLSEIKQVSLNDLKAFLTEDHTSFSVLSLSAKHIQSTERLLLTLTKNSAHSFYVGKHGKPKPTTPPTTPCPCSATNYCNNC
jgi:hypothetical protein